MGRLGAEYIAERLDGKGRQRCANASSRFRANPRMELGSWISYRLWSSLYEYVLSLNAHAATLARILDRHLGVRLQHVLGLRRARIGLGRCRCRWLPCAFPDDSRRGQLRSLLSRNSVYGRTKPTISSLLPTEGEPFPSHLRLQRGNHRCWSTAETPARLIGLSTGCRVFCSARP